MAGTRDEGHGMVPHTEQKILALRLCVDTPEVCLVDHDICGMVKPAEKATTYHHTQGYTRYQFFLSLKKVNLRKKMCSSYKQYYLHRYQLEPCYFEEFLLGLENIWVAKPN